MVARNRARYLAPIALAAAIAGSYLIVHAGLTVNPNIDPNSLQAAQRLRLRR